MMLRKKPPDEEKSPCEFDDEFCCVDFDDVPFPRIIPFTCRCLNTTESIYNGLDTFEKAELYPDMLQNLVSWNLLEQEEVDAMGPTSCHPYNQGALAMSQPKKLGISLQEAMETPISAQLDMLVLLVVYSTMGGLEWGQSEGWYGHIDVCNYFGIDCIFTDTISRLWMPRNGLQGPIPTELGLLTSLRELDLSSNDNEVFGPIPTQLESLTSLGILDLAESQIDGPIPTFLGNMTSLNKLDLASCGLTGTIPSAIFQLQELSFLSLSDNKLNGTLSTEFGKFSDLDILRLNKNDLTGTLPLELMNMETLGLLHVADNKFSGAFPEFLGLMPRLRLLDVSNSGFTGSIPESFCGDAQGGELAGIRQVVVNCSVIAPCSCCNGNGSQGVRMICAENN